MTEKKKKVHTRFVSSLSWTPKSSTCRSLLPLMITPLSLQLTCLWFPLGNCQQHRYPVSHHHEAISLCTLRSMPSQTSITANFSPHLFSHTPTDLYGCWLVYNHFSPYFEHDGSFILLLFWQTHITAFGCSLSLPNHPLINHSFPHTALLLLFFIWDKTTKWRPPSLRSPGNHVAHHTVPLSLVLYSFFCCCSSAKSL